MIRAHKPIHSAAARRMTLLAACMIAPAMLGGCGKVLNSNDVTGSIPSDGDAELRRQTEQLARQYNSSPNDKNIAIRYSQALRQRAQFAQAVAVLQNAAIKNSQDKAVLGAYGKALADAGRLDEAAEVLPKAHTPDNPNWTILSAQGSVADRQGNHELARQYYRAALKITPGEPAILSNLGLSYTLTKELPRAEQALRQAAESPRADARVRQNLALVLSLEGRYAEAEKLGERDMSPQQSAANVNSIRQMAAQSDTWRDLRALDKQKPAASIKSGASAIAKAEPKESPRNITPLVSSAAAN